MAGIDYTIPGQFKPIQIESPMNAMTQAMQLRGLQEASQLNALKMQEYQQDVTEKNELAKIYANPNLKPGSQEFFNEIFRRAPRAADKLATAEAQRQLALSTQQTREQQRQEEARKQQLARRAFGYRKIATAEDYGQAANLIERSVREGEISREEGDDMLSRLTPDSDIKQFRNNVLQNMLEPEKALEEQRATEKHAFVLDKEKTDKFERRLKLYQSVVPSVNTIDGVSQIVSAMYQDPDLEPILSQIRPYADALNANLDSFNQDSENWKLTSSGVNPKDIIEAARNKIKTAAEEERKRAEEERKATEFEQKQTDRTAPKPEKYELGGKVITIDMNPLSPTYNQQIRSDEKSAAPAALTESPLAKLTREKTELAAKDPNSPMLKVYDEAISKETGGAPPELVREYLFAQKNNGFKGSLLDFKKQVAMAGRSVTHNAAPVQTVTVQGANGPEMRDARTGRLITDDKGRPLKPYDASNKPLSPVQQQKLKKDRLADDAKITSAKDMADDIEKNVDALLGNEKKGIRPHPGLPGITGYNAMLPSLPGGQPRAAQQLLDSVKGKVTQVGKSLASQEGKLGNMAVQEWKIVADAVERIDPAAPNFADQLRSVVSQARRLETNLKSRRDAAYESEQSVEPSDIQNKADAILKGR